MRAITRREVLTTAAGAVGVGGLAGCSGDAATGSGGDTSGTTVQASFFVFGDVARAVAGETATAELLVPVGQHGHGWEPGPRVRENIRDADLLVHGMEGFQPWVDDIRGDLADVPTVDVSASLDLLEAGDHHDHEQEEHHDHEQEEDHDHEQEEHHDEEEEDDHGHEQEEEHQDHGHEEEDDHQDHEQEEEHHDHEQEEDDHGHEQEHQDHGHEQEEEHQDHGHGAVDPHFWMDPLRVADAVGTVRQGFADVDADSAGAYADNAEAYRERLAGLHERIESTVADAPRDVVLVAGHDAFQYLGDRYGLEIRALTDVSPDDRPTPRDIDRAQDIIETHDLSSICADPLESQQAADQLAEETTAEEVLPLTAMPGLTEEWSERGWGYVEVMENVNLPTLERALEA